MYVTLCCFFMNNSFLPVPWDWNPAGWECKRYHLVISPPEKISNGKSISSPARGLGRELEGRKRQRVYSQTQLVTLQCRRETNTALKENITYPSFSVTPALPHVPEQCKGCFVWRALMFFEGCKKRLRERCLSGSRKATLLHHQHFQALVYSPRSQSAQNLPLSLLCFFPRLWGLLFIFSCSMLSVHCSRFCNPTTLSLQMRAILLSVRTSVPLYTWLPTPHIHPFLPVPAGDTGQSRAVVDQHCHIKCFDTPFSFIVVNLPFCIIKVFNLQMCCS